MGQAPLTGTACPFPFTNTSTSLECGMTCAEFLGGRLLALQIVALTVGTIGLAVYILRITLILGVIQQSAKSGVPARLTAPLRKSLEFWSFVGLFLVLMIISNVDIRGFANLYPAAAYSILTEMVGATIICAAFLLVDFWIVCATPMGSTGIKHKEIIVCLVYVVIVGLHVGGILDIQNFNIWDAAKNFAAVGILISYQIIAYQPIQKIRRTLREVKGDTPTASTENHKAAMPISKREQTLKRFNRKVVMFYTVAALATLMYMIVAIVAVLSRDPVSGNYWKITCDLGFGNILSKTVQILAAVLSFTFFEVPRRKEASQQAYSKTGSDQAHPVGGARLGALVPAHSGVDSIHYGSVSENHTSKDARVEDVNN